MSTRSRTGVLLALLVTVSVLSTGIAGVALADSSSAVDEQPAEAPETAPDGDAVVENFTERIETLETVEFTRTIETEYNNETTSRTVRVVADLESNQKRTETIESSYGSNTTTVTNETHMRVYDADENTVRTVEYESQGVSMLAQLTQFANESAVEYEYAGTDTVNGEEVYVLDATPTRTYGDQNVSMTVAVDTETYFPVQVSSDVRSDQYNVSSTQTYSNVSINHDVPESTFELDVPADATEQSYDGPEIESYDEYDSLQSNTDLSLPPAELPGDFEFERAQIVDGDGYYSVSLTYTNGEDRVHVSVQDDSVFDWSERDGVEAVTLGEETGYYNDYDEYGFLYIDTGEQSYQVYGELDRDVLVEVGAAVVDD
jgi:outer membrane lipoprotein-sorting protein